MTELNRIYNQDCLEGMKLIDDKSIDFVLCDLPFGITAPKWDSVIDFKMLWDEYQRIIKPNGTVALFASQPFTTKLISSNIDNFRYNWYWIKNQGTNFFHAKRMPIRKVEEICIFFGKRYNPQIVENCTPTNPTKGRSNGAAYYGVNTRDNKGGKTTRFPVNILEFKCVDNYSRMHSAQKPIDLCEYLIRTYTDEGDIVLDNCIGSGTTAIAARNTKRNYIGFEKEKEIFETAVQRIK